MYAINICDWSMIKPPDDFFLRLLVRPVVEENYTANCEPKQIDGESLVFTCNEERGAAIVEVARKKFEKHQLRFYQKTGKAKNWQRI